MWTAPTVRRVVAWALVAPFVVWLVVRVAGVGAGTVVETLVVFTPYVALASLVVLGAAAVLRVWPAVAAAGACCAGYALVMAPLFVAGPQPSTAPAGPQLRVMSSNVQFGWADAATVVRLVDEREIDVLGVQELTPAFHAQLRAAGIDDLLPHALVDARSGASGTGLYSRHPVERVELEIPAEHEHPTGRIDVPGAPPLQVTVVHPVPPVLPAATDEWRHTLGSLPAADDDDDTVHLLVGDFNATVDQPTMRELLAEGYVDAAGAVGRGWSATWRSPRGPMLAIDHVLVERSVAVDGVSVHDLPGSDHRNLVARLRLPAADRSS